MKKFVLKFVLAGIVIPLFFLLLYFIATTFHGLWWECYVFIFTIPGIILWPTAIWLMAAFNLWTTIISIIANAILYGVVGILVWLIYKRKTA